MQHSTGVQVTWQVCHGVRATRQVPRPLDVLGAKNQPRLFAMVWPNQSLFLQLGRHSSSTLVHKLFFRSSMAHGALHLQGIVFTAEVCCKVFVYGCRLVCIVGCARLLTLSWSAKLELNYKVAVTLSSEASISFGETVIGPNLSSVHAFAQTKPYSQERLQHYLSSDNSA